MDKSHDRTKPAPATQRLRPCSLRLASARKSLTIPETLLSPPRREMMSPLRKLRGHIGFGDSAVHIFYGDCLGVSKPTGFWLPQRREQEEW